MNNKIRTIISSHLYDKFKKMSLSKMASSLLTQIARVSFGMKPRKLETEYSRQCLNIFTSTGLGDSLMSGPAVLLAHQIHGAIQVICRWDIFPDIERLNQKDIPLATRTFVGPVAILRAHPAMGLFLRWNSSFVFAPQEYPGPRDYSMRIDYRGSESEWHFDWMKEVLYVLHPEKKNEIHEAQFSTYDLKYKTRLRQYAAGAIRSELTSVDFCIHLGGKTMGEKYYPRRRELCEAVEKKGRLIIVGSSQDEYCGVGEDWRGRLNLRELMGVLLKTRFIGHDSGPYQLAARLNPKALCLYGPSNRERTAILDSPSFLPLKAHVPCQPCTSPRCFWRDQLACMSYSVEEILK